QARGDDGTRLARTVRHALGVVPPGREHGGAGTGGGRPVRVAPGGRDREQRHPGHREVRGRGPGRAAVVQPGRAPGVRSGGTGVAEVARLRAERGPKSGDFGYTRPEVWRLRLHQARSLATPATPGPKSGDSGYARCVRPKSGDFGYEYTRPRRAGPPGSRASAALTAWPR